MNGAVWVIDPVFYQTYVSLVWWQMLFLGTVLTYLNTSEFALAHLQDVGAGT
jgi:hypothetical protein